MIIFCLVYKLHKMRVAILDIIPIKFEWQIGLKHIPPQLSGGIARYRFVLRSIIIISDVLLTKTPAVFKLTF